MRMYQLIGNYIQECGFIKNVIAAKSGIEPKTFYRILSGNKKMTVEEYENICKNGLGLDPAYFFKQKISKSENKQTA